MGRRTSTMISSSLLCYILATCTVRTLGSQPCDPAEPTTGVECDLSRVRRDTMCPSRCSCNSATATTTCIWTSLDNIGSVPVNARTMSFRGGKLKKVPKGAFADFAKLRTLHLDQNRIKTLTDGSFAGLSSMKRLTLSRNALWVIPRNSFRGLGRVTRLDLSKNRIAVLSSYIFTGLTSLVALDLRDNPITYITESAFAGVAAIRQLYLRGCPVNNIAYITRTLRFLSSLQTLQMQAFQISYLPARTFPYLPNLTSIDLGNWKRLRRIHPFAFSGLSLKTLVLNGCSLTSVPSQTLVNIPSLVNLSLSGNPIQYIQPYDFYSLKNLQNLYLKNLNILDVREMGFAGLDSLTSLDLSNNRQLRPLRRTSFGSLKTAVYLNVSGSSWKCDCNVKWITAHPNIRINRVTCNSPPLWRNKNLLTYKGTRAYSDLVTCNPPTVAVKPSALNASVGQNVTMACFVSGDAASTINWVLPNRRVVLVGLPWKKVSTNQTGSTGVLSVRNVSFADAGRYVCLAYNGGGNRSAVVDLTVYPTAPPTAASLPFRSAYSASTSLLSCLTGALIFLTSVLGCYSIIFPCSRMCLAEKIAIKIDMPETTLSPERVDGRKGNVSANLNIQRSTL